MAREGQATQEQLDSLGVTPDELAKVSEVFQPGETFWRVPVSHFSMFAAMGIPHDYNHGARLPNNATADGKGANKDKNCNSEESGSIIGCESQSLGESVELPGTGVTLNYQSRRSKGFGAERKIDLFVTGGTVSDKLRAIEVKLEIAGQRILVPVEAGPDKRLTLEWNGKDGFGRPVNGSRAAKIEIAYEYQVIYRGVAQFGAPAYRDMASVTGSVILGRDSQALIKHINTRLGSFDPSSAGLGEWTLGIERHYDAETGMLYSGDGSQRSVRSVANTIDSVTKGVAPPTAPGVGCLVGPSPAPTDDAWLCGAVDTAATSDGTIWFVGAPEGLSSVSPDGTFSRRSGIPVYSGSGGAPYCGGTIPDSLNGPFFRAPNRVTADRFDNLYIADTGACVIWKVAPDGEFTRLTGGGTTSNPADGTLARDSLFTSISDVAVGPDGSVFFTDPVASRIRQIAPDGRIYTIAGTGQHGVTADGLPATGNPVDPVAISVGANGTVYWVERWYISHGAQIRTISPSGTLGTLAGALHAENYGCEPEGSSGVNTKLYTATFLEATRSGELLFNDCAATTHMHRKLRKLTQQGTVVDVAGSGEPLPGLVGNGDGNSPLRAYMTPSGASELPNGDLVVVGGGQRVIKTKAAALGDEVESVIPSSDAKELYVFDRLGRHTRTVDADTGAMLIEFQRDSEGRLDRLVDGDGLTTSISRDSAGEPTSIVGPFGRGATLSIGQDGRLASVTDEIGNETRMEYNSAGLLSGLTKPSGGRSTLTYDGDGRLVRDESATGSAKTLSRSDEFLADATNPFEQTDRSRVTLNDGGRETTYETLNDLSGGYSRKTTGPDNLVTVKRVGGDGSRTITSPDGTVAKTQSGQDPRFGLAAPIVQSASVETPAGRRLELRQNRSATLSNPSDPLSVISTTETVSKNGKVATSTFDRTQLSYTGSSPAGRSSVTEVDENRRPTSIEIPGLAPVTIGYDSSGRPAGVSQAARTSMMNYDAHGDLASATDPLGRTSVYEYDDAGKLTSETLPGGRTVNYSYDANGNLVSVTPPLRSAHHFGFNILDQMTSVTSPEVDATPRSTQYSYDGQAHELTAISRPDGRSTSLSYDSAGRLSSITGADGTSDLDYDPSTGKLASLVSPDGLASTFAFDGPLPTSETIGGPVAATSALTYNNDFQLASATTAGSQTTFTYDADGLRTQAGDLSLTSDPQNGLLTGLSLANTTTQISHNAYGEPEAIDTDVSGLDLYRVNLTRDIAGRITTKQEIRPTATSTWAYNYDAVGRLENVLKDGAQHAAYVYDANGNRTSQTVAGDSTYATFDARDRMKTQGDLDLTYNDNGELTAKTNRTTSQSLALSYTTLGDLKAATTPDGDQIEYLLDAAGRRVGKKVDGDLTQGLIYSPEAYGPVAELDQNNDLAARFIYGRASNVPDYMQKGGGHLPPDHRPARKRRDGRRRHHRRSRPGDRIRPLRRGASRFKPWISALRIRRRDL